MNKLNNKGFTLVEVLAVVAIIAILGIIAVPNVLNTINNSTQAAYDILVEDIVIASKQLYEEVEFVGSSASLVHYYMDGTIGDNIQIKTNAAGDKQIVVNLQTLVSNGFLTGSNNPNKSGPDNKNNKIVTNPKTKEDIGECKITIIKNVDVDINNNYKTSYTVNYTVKRTDNSNNSNCPTDGEYAKAS